jgi:hypothetical protein
MSFDSPEQAQAWLQRVYRCDRTEGQGFAVYVAIEKHALGALLGSWFAPLGIPVVALGGYSSQTLTDEVAADVDEDGRDAVLLYATDFDPSGEDIGRDFIERADCFDQVVRVALTLEQVHEFGLPPLPGKTTDSRASGFVERHGELMQVELDALPPDELRALYEAGLDAYWDVSRYESLLRREEDERRQLVPRGEEKR